MRHVNGSPCAPRSGMPLPRKTVVTILIALAAFFGFGNGGHTAVNASPEAYAPAVTRTVTDAPTHVDVQLAAQTTALPASASMSPALKALQAAQKHVGVTRYIYGGASPSGFDCSGLTSWAFKQAGITIPRTSSAQSVFKSPHFVKVTKQSQLQPGDLVFFYSPVSHVGIAENSTTVVHASTGGVALSKQIKRSPISAMDFRWGLHYVG